MENTTDNNVNFSLNVTKFSMWINNFEIKDSLKSSAREKRGQGTKRSVLLSSPMPGSWKNVLRMGENKDDLLKLLALQLFSLREESKMINSVYGTTVLSTLSLEDISVISPCMH